MMDVCLLGTGGMMPLPNRFLTALMVRLNGSSLLIDCGEGTQVAIRKQGLSVHDIDTICITHFHGDHISGLPGLLLSMGNAERIEPLTIIGPRGLQRVVSALRIIAPELPFEIIFHEIEDELGTITHKGYTITYFRVQHNIVCYGYTLSVSRAGKFIPEKAQQNAVPMQYWSRLQKGEMIESDGRVYTPELILGPARKGLKLTYCTDTRPVPCIAEQAKNADLFICEGMYGEPGTEQKAREHKHMTFREAASLAAQANVAMLWLTHYSPSLPQPKLYLEEAKQIYPGTIAAKDGMSTVLEFDKDE